MAGRRRRVGRRRVGIHLRRGEVCFEVRAFPSIRNETFRSHRGWMGHQAPRRNLHAFFMGLKGC